MGWLSLLNRMTSNDDEDDDLVTIIINIVMEWIIMRTWIVVIIISWLNGTCVCVCMSMMWEKRGEVDQAYFLNKETTSLFGNYI